MIKNKKGMEFSFVWLFAILAGTAILFLAIYGAISVGKGMSNSQNTLVAKELTVISDSLQAGGAAATGSVIHFPREIEIYQECSSDSFGYNEISTKVLNKKGKDFEFFGVPIKTTNKYIYSSDVASREFYTASYPIGFAFEIADVLILDSQTYCYIGLDEEDYFQKGIISDLTIVQKKALFGASNCTEDSVRVCFGVGGKCDITVRPLCSDSSNCESEYEVGYVEKEGSSVAYVGNLLYPAIFSSEEIYECNTKRLLYRQFVLSNIYLEKINRIGSRGCNSALSSSLGLLGGESFRLSMDLDNRDLINLYLQTKSLGEDDLHAECHLWS